MGLLWKEENSNLSFLFNSSLQAVQKMYTKGVDYGYDGRTEQ